ncbi:hypothetical protein Rhow_005536 [Rhodococcus wratislaviensis]|uniref:Uncharacterized protein n=1 Tax=Rhodococcus wratislaviensis TaxID=44752 RepID=A0A402CE92_RHOWR|nr:hypothetical protein Rhow_005536 [Rhodococcus wratislaviensis]
MTGADRLLRACSINSPGWCRWLMRGLRVRSMCGGGIHSVRPGKSERSGADRVVHPAALSLTWAWHASQTRARPSTSVRPPLCQSVTWCTAHRLGGAAHPGRVQPPSAAIRASR